MGTFQFSAHVERRLRQGFPGVAASLGGAAGFLPHARNESCWKADAPSGAWSVVANSILENHLGLPRPAKWGQWRWACSMP